MDTHDDGDGVCLIIGEENLRWFFNKSLANISIRYNFKNVVYVPLVEID